MPGRILLVDNDEFQGLFWCDILRRAEEDYEVDFARSPDQALEHLATQSFDLVVTDLRMPVPPGGAFTAQETLGGYGAGISLAREVAKRWPATKVVVYTSGSTDVIRQWLGRNIPFPLLEKPVDADDLLGFVRQHLRGHKRRPRMFVVHGRDHGTLYQVKDLLQNRLKLGEPIILAEQPSLGMALIEKFEHYAKRIDLAFVLLTSDDIGNLAEESVPNSRPRLNVVFEMGYFFGAMRRLSGRIILLTRGKVELPSDIAGVVSVDISNGIHTAEGELRRELQEWLEA
jgi:CheY-like chemotaxis protein